ncbi:MAG: glycerol-3-phosphate dehydrogenase/oxidase [Acidimicrobiia bacterium]
MADLTPDVLVVGAGINGVGTFRDLAFQGVDVLLVDKGDISSGASAAPSRMVHGGLRYLEHGEFRLVKEALRERDLLLHTARHYVHPLPTFIPVRTWTTGIGTVIAQFFRLDLPRPAHRGALMVRSGLTLYDLYTRARRQVPPHDFIPRDEALERWPALTDDIVGVARYHDAWVSHPERLALEVALDGMAAGGTVLTYHEVVDVADGAVVVRNELTDETITVRPRVLINAAGPWIDQVNDALGEGERLIGGTKGSHVVLDHPELHDLLDGEMLYHETHDGRTALMFPWHGKVIAGTTDLRIEDPDAVVTEEREIEYILETVADVVPGLGIDRSHIDATYVGVRPLPWSGPDVAPSKVSRDHSVPVSEATTERPFPVLSLVGGKWTTFRAFAEEVTDDVLERLGRERMVATEPAEIGGAKGYPTHPDRWVADLAAEIGLAPERVEVLLERYGSTAATVARSLGDADAPLEAHPGYSTGELRWIAEHELVVHLDDVADRRTTIAVLGETTDALLAEIADVIAPVLGWDADRVEAEVKRARMLIDERHGLPAPAA